MEPDALRNAPPPGRTAIFFGYVAAAVAAAVAAVVAALVAAPPRPAGVPLSFWLMAALAVAADARPFVAVRRRAQPIFPSICFTFAVLLVWGFLTAVAVQAAAVVVAALRRREARWRPAFNAAQYTLSFAGAALVLRLGGAAPLAPSSGHGLRDVLTVIAAAAVWFGLNYVLVTTAVWLRFGGSWTRTLTYTEAGEALATAALLALAPVLALAVYASVWLVPLALVPLVAVSRMARLASAQERLARTDPLTALPNRTALAAAVREEIAALTEHGRDPAGQRGVALLLLDLDRFKQINDALGHRCGDRVLVEVGRRLAGAVRPGDLVARLGGDEFAVVASGVADVADARRRADRLAAALADPVIVDGLPLDVGGSIGIAVHPEHGGDFATLLQHADVAMYDAKHRGDAVALYAPESDHNTPERLALLADLRTALEDPADDGLRLYYQPQVEMATGRVVGVEALLRWLHVDRGLVDPEELIRVAEHSTVMRLLTMRVLDQVVAQLAGWRDHAPQLRVSVNVSVRDLHRGELVDHLIARLREYDVAPDRLQLEITEGALMADPRRVLATLAKLKRLGVAVSLDDFGTGYSSMLHLRRLPLSEVKIDRSFVLGVATDHDDAAVVRSLIELATALGLRVVAEGVEDERTWRMLADTGCQVAQGWFCARPMPAPELLHWLARYAARQVGSQLPARQG
jgi:diguanylate cyclase (GGDEF)-like protein